MAAWTITNSLILAARGAEAGDGFFRLLFLVMVLTNVGLGVLAWMQAQRIERNTDHIRKLLRQVKPLHSALPLLASWARMTRDRHKAYRERKQEAAEAGADTTALLRIAEDAIDDMDMGEFAKSVDHLFAEVGFRPPPLPSQGEAPPDADDEKVLPLD
jgi:hypothetical protein